MTITFISLIIFSLTGLNCILIQNKYIFSIGLISTQTPIILSNYSSILTSNSGTYNRHGGSTGNYYYEAISIKVNTSGTYIFKSSSTIDDTFGYIYQGNFYSTYPEYNIITQDDDGSGNRQFQLTATLRSDITYILVFTTYNPLNTGSFSISASGPDYVFYSTQSIQTTTTTEYQLFTTESINPCSVNEVSYDNHCYYLDGIGGQCADGYTLGSQAVLSTISNLFVGLTYKTAVSDNCCVATSDTPSNYGIDGSHCNAPGAFRIGPTLNGGGCRNYSGRQSKQLTFCVSN